MRTVALADAQDFNGWRAAARALALERVPPNEVEWVVGGTQAAGDLFADSAPTSAPLTIGDAAFSVPRAFLTLAETVIRHEDPERFSLLYAMLVRLRAGAGALDEGPLAQRLERMAKEVRRAEIGRKLGPAALTESEMPRTRLSQ